MKKRKWDTLLGFCLALLGLAVMQCLISFLWNGSFILHDEEGDPYNALMAVYCLLGLLFVYFLMALIPSYFLFLSTWLLCCICINILFYRAFNFYMVLFLWGIIVFIVSYLSSMTYRNHYGATFLSEKIRHIPSEYLKLHKFAKFDWVQFFGGFIDDKNE